MNPVREDWELLESLSARFNKSHSDILGLSLTALDGLVPDPETWRKLSRKFLSPIPKAEVKRNY